MVQFIEGDEIVPNLWQGSYPGTGRAVAASGFSMLVLCAIELQEPKELFPGVEVVYAPNHDNGDNPLNPERLKIALDAARRVQSAVKNELKVLVTCRAGMNRSGLVTALALHFLYGWDGDTCIRRVRLKRHRWKGYQPLSNPDFTQTLRRIQSRALSKPPSGWQEGPGGILIPS